MSQTNFYLAVATAIPVLLVAYAVTLTAYAKKIGPDYERDTTATVAAFLDVLYSTAGRFKRAARATVGFVRWTKNLAFLGAYILLVLLAAAGEAAALYALLHSSSGETEVLSWVGLAVAFAAVGLPLVIVGLHALPFWSTFLEWKAMKEAVHDVRSIYAGWEERRTQTGWAGDTIDCKRFDADTATPDFAWTEDESLANLAKNAWGDHYPKWKEARVIDANRILVLDEVEDAGGASFFRLDRRRVSELWVYKRRSLAEASHRRVAMEQPPAGEQP
jgi:hypothetical protein